MYYGFLQKQKKMRFVQRSFMPGSQWVYFKLYTGEKTADEILIRMIIPIVKKLQMTQSFQKWFFIRYSDPDFHLRVRILASNAQAVGKIICQFHQKLERWNKERLLWKMQLDTYNRELERYGNSLIEESETIFYVDSECVLSILKKLNNNEQYRWMIGLKLIDGILSDFHLILKEKQKLMESFSESFKTEFGFDKYNAKQFNAKFRENKSIVESVLNNMFN